VRGIYPRTPMIIGQYASPLTRREDAATSPRAELSDSHISQGKAGFVFDGAEVG
jgi:hypothetical protein